MTNNRPEPPSVAVIALGANLPSKHGGPRETLEEALDRLDAAGARVLRRSRWFATPPWPTGSGPDYVNGAAMLRAPEGPHALLSLMQSVETELGRVRSAAPGERWGPRVCDLDILCAGDLVTPDRDAWIKVAAAAPEAERPRLVLPHPQLHRRAFALAPMADVAPDWRHPILDVSVDALLRGLPDEERDAVRLLT